MFVRRRHAALILFCGLCFGSIAQAEDIDPLAANQRAAETRNLRNALMAQPDKPVPIVEVPIGAKLKDALKKITAGYDNKFVLFDKGLTTTTSVEPQPVLSKTDKPKKYFDVTDIPTSTLKHVSPTLKVDYDEIYQDYVRQVAAKTLPDLGQMLDKFKLGTTSVGGNPIDKDDDETLSFIVGFPQPTACSGVRIGKDLVLTAAHCMCNPPTELRTGAVMNLFGSANTQVVLKTWKPDEAQCDDKTSFFGQDIALVQFDAKGPRMEQIPIIRVATERVIEKLKASKETLIIAGYGWRNPLIRDFGHKNFVRSPILSVDCGTADSQKYGCVEGKELVAMDNRLIEGRYYGVGPCNGDSGGAAIAYLDDPDTPIVDKKYFLVAIISRSIIKTSICGDGAIFTLLNTERLTALKSAASQMIGRDFSFAEMESREQLALR